MLGNRYWSRLASLYLLTSLFGATAYGQSYPTKTVTIISDAAPGAAPDVVARFVADGFGTNWGQQAVVLNRPGANGSIGARAAAEAVPDGYTLYFPVTSTFVALPTIAPNLPVKLPRDFLPIGFTTENPMFIAVSPALGVSTLPQLIALAKKEPGTITIPVTGVGRLRTVPIAPSPALSQINYGVDPARKGHSANSTNHLSSLNPGYFQNDARSVISPYCSLPRLVDPSL